MTDEVFVAPLPASGALTGLVVLLAAGLLLSATPANGAVATRQIACGSHPSADTTLTRDLRCTGDGLTQAPGVRLNLGGHQLSGDGTGVGISVVDGDRKAVLGGKIQNWATGIHFAGADIVDLKETPTYYWYRGLSVLGDCHARSTSVAGL